MSFWDCGEYIATAQSLSWSSLEHLCFKMIGAFFAMFASDNEHIALMVIFHFVSRCLPLFLFLVFIYDFKEINFKDQ
jgi:hypothetical protein